MTFEKLLMVVGDEPVFETALLLAGDVDAGDVRRQLSRWVTAGKLLQMRRGLYALAPPYQKVQAHPYLVANRLVRPSYVSLQSALALWGLIPEYVPVTTSITTGRPSRFATPVGQFLYRHVKPELFFGFELASLPAGQQAFVATPEKALLDLAYLDSGPVLPAYLYGLRLQNLDKLDVARLGEYAARFPGTRLRQVTNLIAQLAQRESEEFETL